MFGYLSDKLTDRPVCATALVQNIDKPKNLMKLYLWLGVPRDADVGHVGQLLKKFVEEINALDEHSINYFKVWPGLLPLLTTCNPETVFTLYGDQAVAYGVCGMMTIFLGVNFHLWKILDRRCSAIKSVLLWACKVLKRVEAGPSVRYKAKLASLFVTGVKIIEATGCVVVTLRGSSKDDYPKYKENLLHQIVSLFEHLYRLASHIPLQREIDLRTGLVTAMQQYFISCDCHQLISTHVYHLIKSVALSAEDCRKFLVTLVKTKPHDMCMDMLLEHLLCQRRAMGGIDFRTTSGESEEDALWNTAVYVLAADQTCYRKTQARLLLMFDFSRNVDRVSDFLCDRNWLPTEALDLLSGLLFHYQDHWQEPPEEIERTGRISYAHTNVVSARGGDEVPSGHTGFSWLSKSPVPRGHTTFSWTFCFPSTGRRVGVGVGATMQNDDMRLTLHGVIETYVQYILIAVVEQGDMCFTHVAYAKFNFAYAKFNFASNVQMCIVCSDCPFI